jgi:hypothetical protein
VTVPLAQRKTE